VHLLESQQRQVTVLNFGDRSVRSRIRSAQLTPHIPVTDMFTGQLVAEVDDDNTFPITLGPHQGTALLTGSTRP
jgi:hypothetical protein